MDCVFKDAARRPIVIIPPRRTSSLYTSLSNSPLSRNRSLRREKLRRSLSVQEKDEFLTRAGSPWSPISPHRYSAPPSPIEYPVYLSVDEFSSESCTLKQDWPLRVPRLVVPTPRLLQTDQSTSIHLQIPAQILDVASTPTSPCAYTPLVNDLKFFTAIPRPDHDKKLPSQHSETTLAEDSKPKRLNSLSKKGVKRTASTRAKGHKRGKTPLVTALPEVLDTQVQPPAKVSHIQAGVRSESPSLSKDEAGTIERKDTPGSPLRLARNASRRRKDGNFLPPRAPSPSILQPLTEEPTALERKKMPLVTAIVPPTGSSKVTKSIGPLRRLSTRRRRRMEATQKPLPSIPPEEKPRDVSSPSPDRDSEIGSATITQVISRPMSPAEFEEANTSPSFPGSSFGPKTTSPWSQLFKRAKSPSREEISGFLDKFRGKGREREGGGAGEEDEVREREKERRRAGLRRKIRVVETVNMSSAFED
ncbi:hypothetical protein FKW77_009434 [Venturia effusa]|uniref:Uncharacterized protein n=1 Tax=Venturia effusa TaxID=50376 RepID=A0A517KXA9_9PEZI|nr:hypothetical protein FKW77_009434 [Venturia effusa]